MRIGARLLATYLILIGLMAVAVGIGVPRLVEAAVVKAERGRLQRQAEKLAARVASRIQDQGAAGGGARVGRLPEDLFADETALLVDPKCIIRQTSLPAGQAGPMVGRYVPQLCGGERPRALLFRRVQTLSLEGIGQVVWAAAPLAAEVPILKGWQIMVYRDMPTIQSVTGPIAQGLELAIVIAFLAAMVIAGWVSREMVRRLREVGAAAGAVAEGDLTHRVPESGKDEITELAGHFNQMAERIQALVDGLKRSEQARRDLLMMVGHDLRTPMTSIAGFAEALRDGVVQGEESKQRYYEIIHNEATRLTRLVNDLFEVAKLESGQVDLRLQATPIAPLVVEFAESMKHVAERQGAFIQVAIAPEAEQARVYADRDRLEQVLGNLTSNALRYTPAGGAVTLRARTEGQLLVVEVADQGPGLTPEEADHVFQRFFQGPNQGRGHKGAGLGLAIVKSLVEAHGGQVGVRSSPGEGATFWFQLNRIA